MIGGLRWWWSHGYYNSVRSNREWKAGYVLLGRDVPYSRSTMCVLRFACCWVRILANSGYSFTIRSNDNNDNIGNDTVCACSTCHLILPADLYRQLPDPSEDEEDMLDMAFGLTETSRLGCQITVTPAMDGVVLQMPKATRNFYVDGHKPKPH